MIIIVSIISVVIHITIVEYPFNATHSVKVGNPAGKLH